MVTCRKQTCPIGKKRRVVGVTMQVQRILAKDHLACNKEDSLLAVGPTQCSGGAPIIADSCDDTPTANNGGTSHVSINEEDDTTWRISAEDCVAKHRRMKWWLKAVGTLVQSFPTWTHSEHLWSSCSAIMPGATSVVTYSDKCRRTLI